MPTKKNRTGEPAIAMGVLEFLSTLPEGEASMADIKKAIPDYVPLTEADRAESVTRKGEELWEQQVRNITSHKDDPGNFIFESFLEAVDGGLRITQDGRNHLKHAKG